MTDNPQVTAIVKPCPQCDSMVALGILTCQCESIENPLEKVKCQNALKPLENGSQTAIETVTKMIVEQGAEEFNDTLNRLDMIIYAATEAAKQTLIDQGKLNKDGTPK